MIAPQQKHLKVCQINCENLFLFFDQHLKNPNLVNPTFDLNEAEWQKLSSAQVPNKPLYKTRWLAQTLLEINADVILLNEVGGLESLENFNFYFLNNNYRSFLIEGNSDRGIDVGYLVHKRLSGQFVHLSHKSRPIQFLYPHEVELNRYNLEHNIPKQIRSHYFSRDVSELRWFVEGQNSPSMIFLCVHLKSKLDHDNIDAGGFLRRQAELKALVAIYNEIRMESPEVPLLLGGDFNGFASRILTTEEFEALQKTDLQEVFDILNIPIEECATQINFQRSRARQFLKIDHLFVSPELATQLIREECFVHRYKSEGQVMLAYAQTYEQRTALPSDHYPVVASFILPF